VDNEYQTVIVNREYYLITPDGHVPDERNLIDHMRNRTGVEWAIDNSFDGLHIVTERHLKQQTITYRFEVLLPNDKAIFWRLKFSGQ